MRILYVQPGADRQGHYGLNTSKLCQALAEIGHDVSLWTNRIHVEQYLKSSPAFKIVEVEDGKLGLTKFDDQRNAREIFYLYGYFRNSYLILDRALREATKSQFDIIHTTGIEFAVAALLFKKYSKFIPPAIMEIAAANFTFSTYAGSLVRRTYKAIQTRVFRSILEKEIRGLAVLGDYQKALLRKQLHLDSEFPIFVIPDGGSAPDVEFTKEAARQRLGLDDMDETLFLFFGLLRREKGIETLIEAISRLDKVRFRVLIAGAPCEYMEEELYNLICAQKAEDRIICRLQYIPETDVDLYFYACDALVLPYTRKYTGGSGPLLKGAGMHRRPALVSDVSEMGRLAREVGLALVFQPDDPESLAAQMRAFLMMSETQRAAMAEAGFVYARSHSWDTMARKYTELYEAARITRGTATQSVADRILDRSGS